MRHVGLDVRWARMCEHVYERVHGWCIDGVFGGVISRGMCCIHSQRKVSVMICMCFVLYPFPEEGECNGIRVCLCYIYSLRKEVRWYTCLFSWIASEGDIACAPASQEMSLSRNDCIVSEGRTPSVGYTFCIIVTCRVSYYMYEHVHSCLCMHPQPATLVSC